MAGNILEPVTLAGRHARLVPLSADQLEGLKQASADGELHRLWYTSVAAPERMEAEIARRLALHKAGSMLPFTVLDAEGHVAGMTTYMNIDLVHRRVEIGSTWYARRVQRSGLNTECKLMLLTHAFETLDCIAVEFRTHRLNTQSRRAIERLGAQLDGILRAHQRTADGHLRDTCVYSITAAEWPTIKAHLQWQLEKPRD
ncbi:GNAT family protein [Pelomonas sp. SE-A7]|uniref:GNAT family N-acetyltransferase n=1 Tax=Pelomonas sp. SE-A7 TaxID=3054953 RepID=UPI00259D02CC|nr:GNAT family protein [Pelomonas sp. SE-A7]MDM4767348.1 GNAT family protein [Pelomonas sp. SE-A7]